MSNFSVTLGSKDRFRDVELLVGLIKNGIKKKFNPVIPGQITERAQAQREGLIRRISEDPTITSYKLSQEDRAAIEWLDTFFATLDKNKTSFKVKDIPELYNTEYKTIFHLFDKLIRNLSERQGKGIATRIQVGDGKETEDRVASDTWFNRKTDESFVNYLKVFKGFISETEEVRQKALEQGKDTVVEFNVVDSK